MVTSGGLYCFHPHGILSVGFCANGIWSRRFHSLADTAGGKVATSAAAAAASGYLGTVFLIADNLRRDAGFYEKATLTYKVRVGEKLHTLLQEHGQLLL